MGTILGIIKMIAINKDDVGSKFTICCPTSKGRVVDCIVEIVYLNGELGAKIIKDSCIAFEGAVIRGESLISEFYLLPHLPEHTAILDS